jgi:hypothetical protein
MPGDTEHDHHTPSAAEDSTAINVVRDAYTELSNDDPLATWVVTGRTFRGFNDRFPGALVKLRLFEGFEAVGQPIRQVTLRSNDHGEIRWPLRSPCTALVVEGMAGDDTNYSLRESKPVHANMLPPCLNIYLFPKDATIVGVVHDRGGQPLKGVALHDSVDATMSSDDGRFRLKASTFEDETIVSAVGGGFAFHRDVVRLTIPGREVTLDIVMSPALRVTGRVIDEYGTPIEGAEVRSLSTSVVVATSDDGGHFVLDNLDPDRKNHLVYARHAGYLEATAQVIVNSDTSVDIATNVFVQSIDDLVLRRGVRLEGHVVTEAGTPIEGAHIYIGFSRFAYNRLDATSKDDGSFVFSSVPTGSQIIAAGHPDYAPFRATRRIDPLSPTVAGLCITLPYGHRLAGTVRIASGALLSGIQVSARYQGEYIDVRATTDATGRFELHGLPDQEITVEACSRTTLLKEIQVDRVDRDDMEIVVDSAGRVCGRVIDAETGAGIEDFVIRFVRPDANAGVQMFGYAATWAREGHRFTNTHGEWDSGTEALPPGGILGIEARAPDYATARAGAVNVAIDPLPEACVLRMVRGCDVRGRVVDADGRACIGAHVACRLASDSDDGFANDHQESAVSTCTNDGRFNLGPMVAGSYVLMIEVIGRRPFIDGPFDIPPTGTINRTIVLPRGASLHGRLLDVSRAGLAGETIVVDVLRALNTDSSVHVTTGQHGEFEFHDLPEGPVRVSHKLFAGDLSVYDLVCFLVARSDANNEIELRPDGTGSIAGVLSFPDGTAAPDYIAVAICAASVNDSSDEPLGRGAIARNGHFVVENLPCGRWTISAISQSPVAQLVGKMTVDVNDGQTTVTIKMLQDPSWR